MQLALAYVVTLIVFGGVDLAWLTTMGAALYRPILGDILLQTPRIAPVIAFYALFPVGIVAFAVNPALKTDSIMTAAGYGLLFGAIAYATYDLTNYATLRNWNLNITIIDIVYGGFASAAAATLAILAVQHAPQWLGGAPG